MVALKSTAFSDLLTYSEMGYKTDRFSLKSGFKKRRKNTYIYASDLEICQGMKIEK